MCWLTFSSRLLSTSNFLVDVFRLGELKYIGICCPLLLLTVWILVLGLLLMLCGMLWLIVSGDGVPIIGWCTFFSIWLFVGDIMVIMGYFWPGGLLTTTGMGLELADSVLPVDVLPDVSFYPYRSTLIMCNILFTPESPSISSTLRWVLLEIYLMNCSWVTPPNSGTNHFFSAFFVIISMA